jgi:oligopeptide transport system substrate-binding protein
MIDFSPIFVARGLFEGLVILDENTLEPLPGVADRWEISPNGLVYRFHLRADGRWSNGQTVVAEDFVQAAQRILSPGLASPTVDLYYGVANARAFYEGHVPWEKVGIRALSDDFLEITLERPMPYFFSLLAHPAWSPILRSCIEACGGWERWDNDWARPGKLVSNGPYRLVEWRIGDRVVMEKNPFYRNGMEAGPERVVFFPIANQQTEQNAFVGGELDVTSTVPADILDALRDKPESGLQETEALGSFYYLCNCTRPPLDNIHVRRALALAIDRKKLCQLLHRDGRFVAGHLVPRGTGGYVYDGKEVLWDPKMARQELAIAGYPNGVGLPPMGITFNTSGQHRLIAQAVQEMWRDVLGIAVELNCEDWKSFLFTRRSGNFFIARGGWMGDYNDPTTFLGLFCGDAPNNFSRWQDGNFDQSMLAAEMARDGEERLGHIAAAEECLIGAMPIIPLYFETHKHRVARRVHGWQPNLLDYHLYQNVRLDSEKLP